MDGGKIVVERSVRKLEDVDEFIEHAKLNNEELVSETQVLYFSDTFEDFKLLELNSEIHNELKEGQRVVFRGANDKKAVLCTDSLTFELLEAETSNSSLLIPNLNIHSLNNKEHNDSQRYLVEKTIEGVFYSYYELRKIKSPFINELESLLNTCLYCGPENEHVYNESSSRKLFTTEDLLNICQANLLELKEALKSIGACCIDGYWRLLDFNFHLRVFSQLLNLVNSNSWPLNAVPEAETLEAVEEIFPKIIVQHIFSQYTNPNYERNEDGDALFSLVEDKVCRLLGEALLRDGAGMDFDLQQFIEAWESSVPEGMNINLSQLVGLAVVVDNDRVARIKLCLEKDLPRNIQHRLEYLFTLKSRWTLDELSPYIKPLLPEKSNIRTAVMKYAYESVVDGVKWYTGRNL